jgi:hypothetical protein
MITPAALADPLAGDRIAYRAGVEVKSMGVDDIDVPAAQPPQGEKPANPTPSNFLLSVDPASRHRDLLALARE